VSLQELESAINPIKNKTKQKYWSFPVAASKDASAQSGWTTSVDLTGEPIPINACFSVPRRNVLTTTPKESMSASHQDNATEGDHRSRDKPMIFFLTHLMLDLT